MHINSFKSFLFQKILSERGSNACERFIEKSHPLYQFYFKADKMRETQAQPVSIEVEYIERRDFWSKTRPYLQSFIMMAEWARVQNKKYIFISDKKPEHVQTVDKARKIT